MEGRFNGGFFALRVWGAYIWRGLFSEFYGISERKQKTFLSDARQSEVVFFHFWTVVLPKIFGQIVFIIVKTLRNKGLVALK